MRYQLVFINEDIVKIHVDKRVSASRDLPTCSENPDEFAICKDLLEIDGVVGTALGPYHLEILKGRVFKWQELLSVILDTIFRHFADNLEEAMVEVSDPEYYQIADPTELSSSFT